METLYLLLQQYSSNLAQYERYTFGGFYSHEVLDEIERGKQLVSGCVGIYIYVVGSTVDTNVVDLTIGYHISEKFCLSEVYILLLKLQNVQL